jgi:hypothetical protein
VSRNELLKRLSKSKVKCQETEQSKASVEKSRNSAETKHFYFPDKDVMHKTPNQQMTSSPIVQRKTKRRRLVEALHAAKHHKQLLSKLQEDEKKQFEKKVAQEVALRRVMGERVYTNVKRLKKALKTRKRKQLKKKNKTN